MALRSKEFVGKAENIKSRELSVKSLIESLKGSLLKLGDQQSSIERRLSFLYSELAAAKNIVNEEGEPDYAWIASVENRIDDANERLSDVEDKIDETSGKLEKAEQEFERVEEEKQQTLFEIQQRARTTSRNLSNVSGMYGAYADVGASLNRSFQENFDALAQAAAILDGTVESSNGGSRTASSNNTIVHSGNRTDVKETNGAVVAIAGASYIAMHNQRETFSSSQPSVVHNSARRIGFSNYSNNKTMKEPIYNSSQISIGKNDSSNRTLINFQTSKSIYRTSQSEYYSFSQTSSVFDKVEKPTRKMTSEQKSCRAITERRMISGICQDHRGRFVVNTPRTIEEIRKQMNDQIWFDERIDAGGGIAGQKVHLQGAGKEFYMTSSSKDKASGNFLTIDHPGVTVQQRKENLQLPSNNDATVVDRVRSLKPAVVLISRIIPQEKWAKQSGYTARTGIKQVFTPTNNIKGAIEAGIYMIVTGQTIDNKQSFLLRGNIDSKGNTFEKKRHDYIDTLKITPSNSFHSIMGVSIEDGKVAADFIRSVYSRYEKSEKISKEVFDYVIHSFQIRIKAIDSVNEYYDPKDRSLHLYIKGDRADCEGSSTGYFHEYGHAIDHALGGTGYLSDNDDFLDALKKDYEEVLTRYKADSQKGKKFINFLSNPVAYPISDLIEGLSDGKIIGGYGHLSANNNYWKDKYAVCNEAFAYFFEASMGAPERLEYLKVVFPNAYNQYKKMIEPFVASKRDELEREL